MSKSKETKSNKTNSKASKAKEAEKDVVEPIEEDKKSPLALIVTVFAVLAIVFGIGLINNSKKTTDDNIADKVEDATESDITEASSIDFEDAVETELALDLEKASTPRILGNPDAPIKISEHSSFTCGACAAFHKDNFKQIKKDYVDTGKAYIVFDDFPRNSYDVKIGAIARCVPEKSYFKFIQLLFETQRDWLNEDFLPHIKQNAKLTGASSGQINSCLGSDELKENIAKRQEDAHKSFGIKGTPTLVINDSVVLSGLDPYSKIKKTLDAELDKLAE